MPTVLIAGGGSIGHIAPGIAVAQALKHADAHFVCLPVQQEMEAITHAGFPYSTIDAPRLRFAALWKLPGALLQALSILATVKPNVVFGKGGYVSLPMCLAAWWKGIPVVLHESDAVSGNANRFLSFFARKVCIGFPRKNLFVKEVFTGNPIRREVAQGSREEGARITGFSGDRPVLLVIGGSQGALALNKVIEENMNTLTSLCDIIHITGEGKQTPIPASPHYWQRPFVYRELPHLYAITTLALSRAGAGGMSELAVNGIPTIVAPLEGVGHDHQVRNAEYVAHHGGMVLREVELSLLPEMIRDLITHEDKRKAVANAMETLASTGAAENVARIVESFLA